MEVERLLQDVGLNDTVCQQYFEKEDTDEKILLLKKQRCILLDKIHQEQEKLDCLDYLLYQLKKEK